MTSEKVLGFLTSRHGVHTIFKPTTMADWKNVDKYTFYLDKTDSNDFEHNQFPLGFGNMNQKTTLKFIELIAMNLVEASGHKITPKLL